MLNIELNMKNIYILPLYSKYHLSIIIRTIRIIYCTWGGERNIEQVWSSFWPAKSPNCFCPNHFIPKAPPSQNPLQPACKKGFFAPYFWRFFLFGSFSWQVYLIPFWMPKSTDFGPEIKPQIHWATPQDPQKK